MRIAIAGKGGVGKTTIAGTLSRVIAQRGKRVLALDADSNPNLALALGIPREQAAAAPEVPQGLTEWVDDEDGEAHVHLHKPVEELIARYGMHAPDGVRLLVMGQVLRASIGCRCEAHAVARGITDHLLSGGERVADVTLLDMEAGLEHLGRGTVEHVDVLLIVVEPYYRALEAGVRIRDLAAQLHIPQLSVVANSIRTTHDREAVEQYCRSHDLELLASIPYDEAVIEAEQSGVAPVDFVPQSEAVQAIGALADLLQQRRL
ncbi:MAG: AAA family ATPase [Chloroflexi bacterium]|nr:AAA family ATPase [Chloroflexota bacterium]